jgi:hypothetical protein
VLVLERVLLMLGFSKVVLSEDEGALLGLTQVSHIFQLTKGCSEHVLDLVVFELIALISAAFFQDVLEKAVHFHDVDIFSIKFADFQEDRDIFLGVTYKLNALELMVLQIPRSNITGLLWPHLLHLKNLLRVHHRLGQAPTDVRVDPLIKVIVLYME